jgi:hypothetical protein
MKQAITIMTAVVLSLIVNQIADMGYKQRAPEIDRAAVNCIKLNTDNISEMVAIQRSLLTRIENAEAFLLTQFPPQSY